MTDYSDYKVWKEVELYSDGVTLSEHEEYTPEDILSISTRLTEVAKGKGLEGCYLRFKSHLEPYEDYLGSPSITPCGYRKVTDYEREELQHQENIQKKADELGITFFEANILMQLQERGVI